MGYGPSAHFKGPSSFWARMNPASILLYHCLPIGCIIFASTEIWFKGGMHEIIPVYICKASYKYQYWKYIPENVFNPFYNDSSYRGSLANSGRTQMKCCSMHNSLHGQKIHQSLEILTFKVCHRQSHPLAQDRRAVGSSLTGVTMLCP